MQLGTEGTQVEGMWGSGLHPRPAGARKAVSRVSGDSALINNSGVPPMGPLHTLAHCTMGSLPHPKSNLGHPKARQLLLAWEGGGSSNFITQHYVTGPGWVCAPGGAGTALTRTCTQVSEGVCFVCRAICSVWVGLWCCTCHFGSASIHLCFF